MDKKNAGALFRATRHYPEMRKAPFLVFFYCDGVFFTNFYTAFAAHAFFSINGVGFAVFHFKYFCGANINALFATYTFGLINYWGKCHFKTSLKINSTVLINSFF